MTHVFGRPSAVVNMHIFASCQIDVVNKKNFFPLSRNPLLPKAKIHSLIPLKKN